MTTIREVICPIDILQVIQKYNGDFNDRIKTEEGTGQSRDLSRMSISTTHLAISLNNGQCYINSCTYYYDLFYMPEVTVFSFLVFNKYRELAVIYWSI